MIETTTLGWWTWPDLTQTTHTWNSQMYTLLGADPEQDAPCFETLARYVHPHDQSMLESRLEAIEAQEGVHILTVRIGTHDRILRWVRLRSERIGSGLTGILEDVSDINTEGLGGEDHRSYRRRVEQWAGMGSFRWLPEENRLEWSAGGRHLLGLDSRSLTLEQSLSALTPQAADQFIAGLERAQQGETHQFSLDVLGASGYQNLKVRMWKYTTSEDRPAGVVGALNDVTDIALELENTARLNEALNQSNADLQQFAFVASHDLQEPLRKINMFADRLNQHTTGLDERGMQYVTRMQDAASRMQRLISDLLDFSTVHREEGTFEDINLDALAAQIVEDLAPKISAKQAQVTVGELGHTRGNHSQMYRLLVNLISNGLKFSREGVPPELHVAGEVVPQQVLADLGFTKARHTRYRRIRVADNGIGFDPAMTDKMFEVFGRLHGRSAFDGTGIGLAVCKRIVENHFGYIHASSPDETGAQFDVYLPYISL